LLLREGREVARVLDEPWQEHDPAHWRTAAGAAGRVVLAGGLGPDNVRAAIAAVQPWAVDAASLLERVPGVKDHDKVRAFVEAARG
jgi:phosphoribosylanthranilate isomerase